MIRTVRGPKGPVVPVVDIAEECNRHSNTLRNLAERLKFPLVKIKLKSRHGNRRRQETFCIEARNMPTLMKEAAGLRRYKEGVHHGGGIVGSRTNGSHSPTVPVSKRPFPSEPVPVLEVVAVSREALAAALKPFVAKGLVKLSFDGSTGDVSYAVEQAEKFKI